MKNLENKAYLTMLEISFFIFYVFFDESTNRNFK